MRAWVARPANVPHTNRGRRAPADPPGRRRMYFYVRAASHPPVPEKLTRSAPQSAEYIVGSYVTVASATILVRTPQSRAFYMLTDPSRSTRCSPLWTTRYPPCRDAHTHMLTAPSLPPSQINYIWMQPWTLGTFLFWANRYLPFVDVILGIHGTSSSCPHPPARSPIHNRPSTSAICHEHQRGSALFLRE